MEITDKEKVLLNKIVKSIRLINYNDVDMIIPTGIYGRIVDFGSISGDPVIDWSTFKVIAVIGKDVELVL